MGTKWKTYYIDTHLELTKIKKEPGVYVIYDNEEIVYIGQSNNVKNRLANHKTRPGYSDCIITPWGCIENLKIKIHYSIKYGDWAMRELRLIKRLKPKFNKVVV